MRVLRFSRGKIGFCGNCHSPDCQYRGGARCHPAIPAGQLFHADMNGNARDRRFFRGVNRQNPAATGTDPAIGGPACRLHHQAGPCGQSRHDGAAGRGDIGKVPQ